MDERGSMVVPEIDRAVAAATRQVAEGPGLATLAHHTGLLGNGGIGVFAFEEQPYNPQCFR
jgi:hypothetical protein